MSTPSKKNLRNRSKKTEVNLRKSALINCSKMSELERLQELGRQGFQLLIDVFHGPPVFPIRQYDRSVQESLRELYSFAEAFNVNPSQKLHEMNKNTLDVIRRLFAVSPLIPVGQSVNVPDIDDVNVINDQEKNDVVWYLIIMNNKYNMNVSVVGSDQTSSSGNEVS